MPRPKPTEEDLKERESRASEVKQFLIMFKFTELRLAQTLGVSRRTIQMMKAGRVSPHPTTVNAWNSLQTKYKRLAR